MTSLKKHTSLHDQVNKLQDRGLVISDHAEVEEALFNLNYYRLSGYLHAFKKSDCDAYIDNLTWQKLKHIYDFDRKLTRVLMYALEDIEETLKTRLSYTITSLHPEDPLIYLSPTIYRDYNQYTKFSSRFYASVENNKELPFVKHHKQVYGGMLPMWVAVELFTMGNIHAVYDNLLPIYQKTLAKAYCTGPNQLKSWIANLTYTRNHLAHYMRIYNFNFGRTPVRCSQHPQCYPPTGQIFDQVCIMSFMYSDPDEWNNYVIPEMERVFSLYKDDVELSCIGFPDNWKDLLIKQ